MTKKHITNGEPCWCNPILDYKDPVTCAEVWIHKDIEEDSQDLTISYMAGYSAGVKAEREACAKVCEEVGQDKNYHGIAAAIRARGEK